MKVFKKVLAVAALAASLVSTAHANISFGGLISIPTGAQLDTSQLFENVVLGVGSELKGTGEITTINGLATSTFCLVAGCELTFVFDQYIAQAVGSGAFSPTVFSGGRIQIYLHAPSLYNPAHNDSGSDAADILNATNGTLFLTLVGDTSTTAFGAAIAAGLTPAQAALSTLSATQFGGAAPGTPGFQIFGGGLLDVATNLGALCGVACSAFDTNGKLNALASGGNSDIEFSSNSQSDIANLPHDNGTPGINHCFQANGQPGAQLIAGGQCLAGGATFSSNVVGLPEPASLALFGVALFGVAVAGRRTRKQ